MLDDFAAMLRRPVQQPRRARFGGLDSATTYRVQVIRHGALVADVPLSGPDRQVELRLA